MAVETLAGARIMTGFAATPMSPANVGIAGGRVRFWSDTVEVSAGASATSTYTLARLPAAARLLPISRIHHDDLATTGAPTIDVGLVNPAGKTGITDDDDALAANVDVASGAGAASLLSDITRFGKRLWELVASQTVDPGHELEVVATLKDAAANSGGTLTLELYYTVD